MKGRGFKRIWGEPWDYEYLLRLEQRKLKEMTKFFKSDRCYNADSNIIARDCELCVKLIDIVLEEDLETKRWNNEIYNCDFQHIPLYVNVKTSKKFNLEIDLDKLNELLKIELRKRKAFYLYNKIRYYKMMTWFD